VPRGTKDLPGELLAPAAAELLRRLPSEAAELVPELAREAAQLSCSLFADLMGDFPRHPIAPGVHRLFSLSVFLSLLAPQNSGAGCGAGTTVKTDENR
jgi:hypothetical protein